MLKWKKIQNTQDKIKYNMCLMEFITQKQTHGKIEEKKAAVAGK